MGCLPILAPNIPGAGNAGAAARLVPIGAGRVLRAAGAAVPPEFSGCGAASRSASSRGAIGGNLPFSGWSMGQVRMAKSECGGQAADFAAVSRGSDQPSRLTADRLRLRRRGRDPLRAARDVFIPVAQAGNRNGEKAVGSARSAPCATCQADAAGAEGRKNGREIPPVLTGSGVRAARSAGVNGRSARRPKIRRKMGQGEGFAWSCARGVNETGTLESGRGGVN